MSPRDRIAPRGAAAGVDAGGCLFAGERFKLALFANSVTWALADTVAVESIPDDAARPTQNDNEGHRIWFKCSLCAFFIWLIVRPGFDGSRESAQADVVFALYAALLFQFYGMYCYWFVVSLKRPRSELDQWHSTPNFRNRDGIKKDLSVLG